MKDLAIFAVKVIAVVIVVKFALKYVPMGDKVLVLL